MPVVSLFSRARRSASPRVSSALALPSSGAAARDRARAGPNSLVRIEVVSRKRFGRRVRHAPMRFRRIATARRRCQSNIAVGCRALVRRFAPMIPLRPAVYSLLPFLALEAFAAAPSAAERPAPPLFPGERHLADLRQLTFGGENAEAYWSPDGTELVLQSTRPPFACDQIFRLPVDRPDGAAAGSRPGRGGRPALTSPSRRGSASSSPRPTTPARPARRRRRRARATSGRSTRSTSSTPPGPMAASCGG